MPAKRREGKFNLIEKSDETRQSIGCRTLETLISPYRQFHATIRFTRVDVFTGSILRCVSDDNLDDIVYFRGMP